MVRNNSLPDSAGFLIRFGRRFTASRANSASPQTVPLVAVTNPNLIDGICASIRSIMLFVSIFRLVRPYLPFSCLSLLFYTYYLLLPSTPQRLTVRASFAHLRTAAAQGLSPYWRVPTPLAQIKYGEFWNKIKLREDGFSGLFSGTVSLKNFVQILDRQVFALIQKTDCLSRQAASLTFSCIAFSKVLYILESQKF